MPPTMRSIQSIYFVYFSVIALCFLLPLLPLFYVLALELSSVTVLAMVPFIGLNLLLWRLGVLPLVWAQNLYHASLVSAVVFNAWFTGGLTSSVMVWLGIVPVLPMFTSTTRFWVYSWIVFCLATVMGFYVLQVQGLLPHSGEINRGDMAFRALMYAMLLVTQISLIKSVDMLNEGTVRQLLRTNKLLKSLSNDLQVANAHKDRFLAMVSHELRTPLNAVIGYLSLLQADASPAGNKTEFVKGAYDSASHLLTIINDLLDFSQIQNGKVTLNFQAANLRTVLQKTHHILEFRAQELGLSYTLAMSPSVPDWVLADQHRLSQILINLLGNALKFTPQGHVVTEVHFESTGTDIGLLTIAVIDSGLGIPAAELEKIFEPFVQLAHPNRQGVQNSALLGNGLGLSITRSLVSSHGGTLGVKSDLGRGSTFRVDIPLKLAEAPVQSTPTTELMNYAAIKLLVVDDHLMNRMVAKASIQKSLPNAQVDEAENAIQGLEKMSQQLYDLVLLDLVMPDLDGLEVMRRVKTDFEAPLRDVKVIGWTANAGNDVLENCLAAGMLEVLPKPFDRHVLIQTISKYHSQAAWGLD